MNAHSYKDSGGQALAAVPPESYHTTRTNQKMVKDQYLAGKVAIVTGASKISGIGAATAIALAEHGANV